MNCPKHGCVMTETITDDVFCGVCRTAELIEALTPFAEIGERYERDLPQEGDWMYRGALRAYRNATGQRQVRKPVYGLNCGVDASETPSSRKSRKSSAAQSCVHAESDKPSLDK